MIEKKHDSQREQFEAAVIKRMKESGFLEVEIRTECLGRAGDRYRDASINAYWHFWQESRAALVVELPQPHPMANTVGDTARGIREATRLFRSALEAAGVKVAP